MQRSIVDLPEPDGPAMTTASPALIARSISSSTTLSPKLLRTSRSSTRGGAASLFAMAPTLRSSPAAAQRQVDGGLGRAATMAPDVARGLLDRRRPDRRGRRRRVLWGVLSFARRSTTPSTTSPRAPAPGMARVELEARKYIVYLEGPGVDRDFSAAGGVPRRRPEPRPGAADRRLQRLADVLDERPQRARAGHGQPPRAGVYELRAATTAGPSAGFAVALGDSIAGRIVRTILGAVRDRWRCCWLPGSRSIVTTGVRRRATAARAGSAARPRRRTLGPAGSPGLNGAAAGWRCRAARASGRRAARPTRPSHARPRARAPTR